jgi:hypothetical protein
MKKNRKRLVERIKYLLKKNINTCVLIILWIIVLIIFIRKGEWIIPLKLFVMMVLSGLIFGIVYRIILKIINSFKNK